MRVFGQMMARGEGSTLRRKNVRNICGKSMLYWSLKHALDAGFMDEIFVFTEDQEIAQITEQMGCKVIERPKEMIFYHGGFSNPNEWGRYFEAKIKGAMGGVGNIIVGLNCNICLLKGETLRQMYVRLMEDELAQVIYPVVEVEPHLYMENTETGYLFPVWDDPGLDRQKFPKLYRRVGVTIRHKKRTEESPFQKRLHHVIPFEESLDLHSEDDILMAQAFLKRRLQKNTQGLDSVPKLVSS